MTASVTLHQRRATGTSVAAAPTAERAARVSVGTALLFLVLLAALHVAKPDLDPSWRMVSEYAIGRHGWMMIAAFIALATSSASAMVAVRPLVSTRAGRFGVGLMIASSIAMAAAGVFVSDPITATKDQLTMHGNLHGLSATIGIPGFPIAAALIAASLARTHRFAAGRRALLAAGQLPWISLVLMIVTIAATLPATGGRFTPDVPAGLPNRLLVVSFGVWNITLALFAGRLRRETD